MRAVIRLLSVVGFICASVVVGAARSFDPSDFVAAAQDGSGLVWAVSRSNQLIVFEGGNRQAIALPNELREAKFVGLQSLQDGRVLMLWQQNQDTAVLTESKGSAPKIRTTFHATLRDPTIFCDSAGNIWIADPRQIHCVAAGKNEAELSYEIPAEFYDHILKDSNWPRSPRACEDAQHRLWFWSEPGLGDYAPALRGILRRDGQDWRLIALDELPSSRFGFLVRKDEEHFWIGVNGDGLFILNSTTLKAEKIAQPEPAAFLKLVNCIPTPSGTLIVAQSYVGALSGTLWMEHDRSWKKLVEGLDVDALSYRGPRGILDTSGGIFLGGAGTGLWRVKDGAAMRIDWRAKFPLHTVNALFALRENRFLALQFSQGRSDVSGLRRSQARRETRVTTVAAPWTAAQDARGHIWMVRPENEDALAEWTGTKWIFHSTPDFAPGPLHEEVAVDSAQRVWTFPYGVSVFDPATDKWETFDDFRAAVQAQIGTGVRLEHFPKSPMFSKDGRVVFTHGSRMDYFNGHTWRQWKHSELPGSRRGVEAAFFSDDDVLTYKTSDEFWQFPDGTGWRRLPHDVEVPEGALNESGNRALLARIANRDSRPSASDRFGILWSTDGRNLYRSALGNSVAVFTREEVQPFIDGRTLAEGPVMIDPQGNAVIRSSLPAELVFIRPQGPLPETGMRLVNVREATASIELSNKAPSSAWWRWRVDGGPWRDAGAKDGLVSVNVETNGRHSVEAFAIDDKLQVDPTPARVDFDVQVNWKDLIAREIDRLGSADETERAAAILVGKGEVVLPRLREARVKASGSLAWWIDATIQEIERARPPRESSPAP